MLSTIILTSSSLFLLNYRVFGEKSQSPHVALESHGTATTNLAKENLYKYYSDIIKNDSKPCAIIDMNFLDENAREILKNATKPIRLATKSIRSIFVLKYLLKTYDFTGLMCFSPYEALHLLESGFDNILIGYPVMNVDILTKLLIMDKKIYFMVDHPSHLDALQKSSLISGRSANVCIDIDMSYSLPGVYFGVYRSSIDTMQKLKTFLDKCQEYTCLKITGLMGYEAQIAGISDNNPYTGSIMNQLIALLKRFSSSHLADFRKNAVKEIQKRGIHLEFVNGGGTGSLAQTQKEEVVTEVTVGSGLFSPHLFDHYSTFKYKSAAFYCLEIVRNPRKCVYTCFGGGFVASGGYGKEKWPEVYLPEGARLRQEEGVGEVQTPLLYDGELNVGDSIFLRHAKAGELCEHFNDLILVRDGKIEDRVCTYRGEGITY